MGTRNKLPTGESRRVVPFVGLADRHKWFGLRLEGLKISDPAYYRPLLVPNAEGRQAYMKLTNGKCGCQKDERPSDAEVMSVLVDVAIPPGLDARVMLHCDECLPCLLWAGRMYGHFLTDLPGVDWSAEVAKDFPLVFRSWENEAYRFRVAVTSVKNGPSLHVFRKPYAKTNVPLIVASSAGVFGFGDYPLPKLVSEAHERMARSSARGTGFSAKLPSDEILTFSRELGFTIAAEVEDFLAPYTCVPPTVPTP